MKKTFAVALALTLAVGSLTLGSALAQQPGNEHPRAAQGGTQVTEYTFGDHAVSADTLGPDGLVVPTRLRTRRDTLIQPRVHYVNEMLKSIETL